MRGGRPVEPQTCATVYRRLDDYLDRELSCEEIAWVEEHLDLCAMCASEFRIEADVVAAIRAKVARASLPGSLRERVHRILEEARRDR